tara:strand:+ start:3909 stop:6275 length:2367 start_codon:yes stop_codon:yes gene_type:complete
MKLIEFIKLIVKHKVVLLMLPILIGLLAMLLTKNPNRKYYSQTMLFTGLASGSSIDMDKSFNYFATNIAFDNLINIVNSRETQEEVAIRLLSQHLLLEGPNERFISIENYNQLKSEIPKNIYKYVIKSNRNKVSDNKENDTLRSFPPSINNLDYEKTVAALTELMKSNNSNFVYSLLNFDHPTYSLEAISKVQSTRISNSDLVRISFEAGDPGICQQTLAIFNEVCIKKYKDLKENGSDAVVQYFKNQLAQSQKNLSSIEDRLLKFNQDNSIINYYEQSKAVAIVKEEMEVEYNKKRADLASSKASSKKLEQKLQIQELVQNKSAEILINKKKLGVLKYEIVMMEAKSSGTKEDINNLKELKKQVTTLNNEIESSVHQLYSFQNSVEGVPIKKILPLWVDQVVETEGLKAKLTVMSKRNKEFQQKYADYAPAGANLKRIEREIDVAEQEYLEILHGLNLAKLKYQDTQLSSNLKAIDLPYFPLKPMPSKRIIIIIATVFMCFIILLGSILIMEFFDNTLKNISVASEKLKISALGMMPKIFKTKGKLDFERIQNRLLEFIVKNMNHFLKTQNKSNDVKTIILFSIRENEGKTVMATNIARKLKESGKSVMVLNHETIENKNVSTGKFPLLNRLFGYQDPRSDYSQPLLSNANEYLNTSEYKKYELDSSFFAASSYKDLTISQGELNSQSEYVIIELPNILETNYPADLIESADMTILICRSNRIWSKADENLLENIKELTKSKLQFIINGTELNEVETILGELPKKRSKTRTRVKDILQFQFYSKTDI